MLQRGAWLSSQHDEHYGKNFKMRDVSYWGGSRKLKNLVNMAASLELDVYQFGVYTGGTMNGIGKSLRGFGHLYGFDSFVGLPPETAGEPLEGPHWRPGAFSAADAMESYSLEALLGRVMRRVARQNTTLIPGFYNESLTASLRRRYRFQPALLVDVDVDLHSSAMQCLSWMFESGLIVPGTYIRYDDWRNMRQQHGEARAHREITALYNVSWLNLGSAGNPNSREWQVVGVGGPTWRGTRRPRFLGGARGRRRSSRRRSGGA